MYMLARRIFSYDNVLRAILLRKNSEFPSGTRLTGDQKVVGSGLAWELRNFSE